MGVVACRLWRIVPKRNDHSLPCHYALELSARGQRHMQSVGQNLREAIAIMDLLVRNTVTPCTLKDVLEDLTEDSNGGDE